MAEQNQNNAGKNPANAISKKSKQRVTMDMARLEEIYAQNKVYMDLQIPYTIHNVILHAEGDWNGKYYPARQLEFSAWQAKGLPIYLDHTDNMQQLVGEVSEAYFDPQRKAIVGNVTFIDENTAKKIAYFQEKNGSFRPGLSPTVWIDEIPLPDGRVEARNLTYQSWALVTNPAQGNLTRLSMEEENMEPTVTKAEFDALQSRLAELAEAIKPKAETLSVEDLSEAEIQKHPFVVALLSRLKALEDTGKAALVESAVKLELETGLTTPDKADERKKELLASPDAAIREVMKSASKVKEALSSAEPSKPNEPIKRKVELVSEKPDWTKIMQYLSNKQKERGF